MKNPKIIKYLLFSSVCESVGDDFAGSEEVGIGLRFGHQTEERPRASIEFEDLQQI